MSAEPSARVRPCPVCASPLTVVRKGTLQLDVCDDHGIWLDKGELEELIRRGRLGEATRRHFAVERSKESARLSGWLLGPLSFLFD